MSDTLNVASPVAELRRFSLAGLLALNWATHPGNYLLESLVREDSPLDCDHWALQSFSGTRAPVYSFIKRSSDLDRGLLTV